MSARVEAQPPGTAVFALARALESPPEVSDLVSLTQSYRRLGVYLYERGIGATDIPMFAEVLTAIEGFTKALVWVASELRESSLPEGWGQPSSTWMKVGSTLAPEFNREPVAFGLTTWAGARPMLWFNPDPRFLKSGDSLATNPFEGAVHELGHVTEGRAGARELIQRALIDIVGSADRAAFFLSRYAAIKPTEVWAEATVGANTAAWSRFVDPRSRDLIQDLVHGVNSMSDKPLI